MHFRKGPTWLPAEYLERGVLVTALGVMLTTASTLLAALEGYPQLLFILPGLLALGFVSLLLRTSTRLAERDRALRAADQRYRQIAELTSDYLYSLRVLPDGRLQTEWITDAFTQITGYTSQELEQRGGWATLIHPDDLARAASRADRLFAGQPDTCEFRIITRSGAVRWLRDHARPVVDPASGNIAQIVGVVQDCTNDRAQRALLEQAVSTNWQLLRALDAASNGIVVCDAQQPDYPIIYANAAFVQLTGYDPAEIIGRNCRFLQGPETDPERVAEIRTALRAQRAVVVTLRNYRRDGQLFWNELKLAPVLDEHGTLVAYVGEQTDVTSRIDAETRLRASESKLQLITSQLPSVLWTTDTDLRITSIMGTGASQLVPDPSAYLGKTIAEIFTRLGPANEPLRSHQATLTGRPQRYRLHVRERDFEVLLEPLRDRDGAIGGCLSLAIDRTEAIQTERLLRHNAERSALHAALFRQMAAASLDLDAVLTAIVRHIGNAVGDGCLVRLLTDDGEHVQLAAVWHRDPAYENRLRALFAPGLAANQGLLGYMMRRAEPLLITSVTDDAAARGIVLPEAVAQANFGGMVIVPLIAHGRSIGTLAVLRDPDQPLLTETDREVVVELTSHAGLAVANAQYYQSAQQRLSYIEGLHAVDRAVSASTSLDVTYAVVLEQALNRLKFDSAAVLLLAEYGGQLECVACHGFRSGAIRRTRLRLGEGLAGTAALEQRPIFVPDLAAEPQFVRAELLAEEGFRSYGVAPLEAKGRVFGVLEGFARHRLESSQEWREALHALASQLAIAIENHQMVRSLQRARHDLAAAYDATLEGWSRALDLRDKETEGHSQRVTEMALRLGRALNLDETALLQVRRGALLHDIGKMGIPDAILLKPGPLTPEEWDVMRKHPVYAYQLLSQIDFLRPALDIPYCHHEKWDGSGYPRGLRGHEIPLAARIFAVADVWDALRSDRPYRPGWEAARVRDHIAAAAGSHFDPLVVTAFLGLDETAFSQVEVVVLAD